MAEDHSRTEDQRKVSSIERVSAAASLVSSYRPRSRSPTVTSSRRDHSFARSPSPPSQRHGPGRSPPYPARGRKGVRRSSVHRGNDLYRPEPSSVGISGRPRSPPRGPSFDRRQSPRRQGSDSYTPAPRRDRFDTALVASTYRPGEDNQRRRSRTPPRQPRAQREPSPRRRHWAPSPPRGSRSSPRRGRRKADTYAPPPPPPAPPQGPRATYQTYRPSPRQRSPVRIENPQSPNRNSIIPSAQREPQPPPDGNTDMRPWNQQYGRGGSRPPYDHSYGHSGSPHHFPPPPLGPHHQSSYGGGRGWPSQSPYHSSHHGSPYHAPYRQSSHPPPNPATFVPPPPPGFFSGSPPYPPHGFPQSERRTSSDITPPGGRGVSRNGRGHFNNLSWTPATGTRGGAHLPPKDEKGYEVKRPSAPPEEEDDDPFRPSKDLRAEDEDRGSHSDSHGPSRAEMEADPKFKFAFKGKSNIPRQPSAFEQPPKKDLRLVKRIKPRPTLAPDFAASESVYYRKPGNESVVGSGTYGKVFRAIHVYTGEKVALKKIRMEGERDGFPVTAIREVKLLQSLNNDNVVKLQEVMVEKNDCYMVFEYLSHDLTGLLNHPTFKLEAAHKKHLAKQLFEGLNYLHHRGVLHRDIKAANILVSNTGQLKLADFGLARFFAKRRQLDYTNRVITIWYRSPELLLGETQYGPAVDIWSAACVLVEIFTKHAIFPGDGGEINQLDKIYNILGTPTREDWPNIVDMAWFELLRPNGTRPSTFADKYQARVSPAAFELLTNMFSYDPLRRFTAEEVLQHAYFTDEQPFAKRAIELQELAGDWHEFESKALRKEKERKDREERKAREREEYEQHKRKKAADNESAVSGSSDARDNKRQKIDSAPSSAVANGSAT